MTDVMQRLLERLETGWAPKRDEFDPDIKQVDLRSWEILDNMLDGRLRNYLAGLDRDEAPTSVGSEPVVFWGPNMNWVLTTDAFYWLEGP
ncbi:hypothetical protein [Bradyrhizobium sp. S69]|uniref:hypothetical protein n=1 Tax=Bradyrhizobium sp. S69 TaxID=1641856 RepID=UPI00131C9E41|nr:hypothetical protein [Bradyrhizobium sp. S69]